MEDDLREMAQTSYGYGCWNAKFWFVGPEQGMSKDESELGTRVAVWRKLGGQELDDCKEFHRLIGELRWHGRSGKTPVLQRTWAKLLLTLMNYKDLPYDVGNRKMYQANEWGSISGETCVIELSGIAAHSTKIVRDRESFLEKRIATICTNIETYQPEFVLLYGKTDGCLKAWKEITQGAETVESGSGCIARIWRRGTTLVAWSPHPVSYGQTSRNWETLGLELQQVNRLAQKT